jgi:exo-beta-1,3-glucanase (GH17 family)
MEDKMTIKLTEELQKGDLVDLEDDPYYDTDHTAEYFYFWVESVEVESITCALVTFIDNEGTERCCGFPLDHKFKTGG